MTQLLGQAVLLRCPPGTTFQDQGRLSAAKYGIPYSGAMDQKSFRWANHVLQNSCNAVALEMAQPGLRIQFDQACHIALSGAHVVARLNQLPILNSSLLAITAGDLLEIGAFLRGNRLYLCIQGGFQTESRFGSRSDFDTITASSKRNTHEKLYYKAFPQSNSFGAKPRWKTSWFESPEIDAYRGADWGLLPNELQELIGKASFHLSNASNRMGIQLEELIPNHLEDLPTNPVFPGTVQLTPGGKIIVLMRDAGVTGGYPRILQLTEEGQSKLAQKKVGDPIRFQLLNTITA